MYKHYFNQIDIKNNFDKYKSLLKNEFDQVNNDIKQEDIKGVYYNGDLVESIWCCRNVLSLENFDNLLDEKTFEYFKENVKLNKNSEIKGLITNDKIILFYQNLCLMKFLYYGETGEPGRGTKRELIQLTADFSQIFNGVYDEINTRNSFSSFQNYICQNIETTFDLFEDHGIRFLRETKITFKKYLQNDDFINYDFKLRNEYLCSQSLEQSHRTNDFQKLDSKSFRSTDLENVGATCYKKNDISLNNEINRLKNELNKANKIIEKQKLKIKELENMLKNNNISLENEIKLKNKEINDLKTKLQSIYINKQQFERNDMKCIYFASVDQKINYAIPCVSTDVFAKVEEELYKEYPEYRETNNYFIYNGKEILRFKTISENNISKGYPVILHSPDN